jgi:hypothetical protein
VASGTDGEREASSVHPHLEQLLTVHEHDRDP